MTNGSHHDGVDGNDNVPCQSDVLSQLLKCISKSQKGREIRIRYVDRKGICRAAAHDRSAFKDVPWTKVPREKELLVYDAAWCSPDGPRVPCFKVVVPRSQVDVVVVIVRLGFLPCLEPKGCEIEVLDLDANWELVIFATMGIARWWCECQSVVPKPSPVVMREFSSHVWAQVVATQFADQGCRRELVVALGSRFFRWFGCQNCGSSNHDRWREGWQPRR